MGKYIFIIVLVFLFLPQLVYFIKAKNYNKTRDVDKFFVKDEHNLGNNRKKVILTTSDGFDIYTNRFDVENPKAVVQIIHGVFEHSGNYRDFIRFLNEQGYAVIASDNRGHGKSVSEKYPSGYIKYLDEVIDDQYVINSYMKMIYPNCKYYIFGHSFGSMIARLFLQKYDKEVDKMIITGTVTYLPISYFGVFLGNIITFYSGEYRKSKLLDKLTGVSDEDISWISYNEENIKIKENDPLRLKGFLARANVVLISSNRRLHDFKSFKVQNKSLPILSLTGKDDKVVGGEKGLYDSISTLEKLGYENVSRIVYENMKHEVLCEDHKDEVYKDIVDFFEGNLHIEKNMGNDEELGNVWRRT